MSTWLIAWFVIGLVTTVGLIAFFIALTRHVIVLGRTARQMQETVQPLADDISRLSSRQQARIEELRTKVPTLRSGGRGREG